MKAVTVDRYGPPDIARVVEVERPAPSKGQVLVAVEAAAVTRGDARIRSGLFPRGFAIPGKLVLGIRGPRRKILGGAFAGRVAQVGPGVSGVAVGDAVAGMNGVRLGAHAEFVVAPAAVLVTVPDGVSTGAAAAALFGGNTARYLLLEKADLLPGERVLVNGASGSVGSAAVQLAAHHGAEVTAVTSAPNADLVMRLGARRAIDYAVCPVAELTDRFDVVLDAVGNLTRHDGDRLCTPGGRLILAVGDLADTVLARGRVIAGTVKERTDDVEAVLDLIAHGAFDPLTDIVGGLDAIGEAYRRIDTGHKVGNLVVTP